MGIQRAAVLYPVNTTVVDSGGQIDVRLLDSAQAGADDDTQTVQATHTQDNVLRTFNPADTGITAANDPLVNQKLGWALRLAEDSTPADDTNCNAMLNAGTLTVNIRVTIDRSGGTYVGGTYGPIWKVSLWRYNITSNNAVLIGSQTNSATTWNYTPVTGDLGTFKTISLSIDVASFVEFLADEVLYLQVGLDTGTIPNPTLGTATWTYTLRVDNANTNITFDTAQGIRVACSLVNSLVGDGIATKDPAIIAMERSATGDGVASLTKSVIASKSFNLVGDGVVSRTRQVVASRSYDLIGNGEVSGRIEIPIDEVPEAAGDTFRPIILFDD